MSDKKPGLLKRIFSFGRKKGEEPVVEEAVEEIAEVEEAAPVIEAPVAADIPAEPEPEPVSYTHLTLPTICSV